MCFDKTGTLTTGKPSVTNVVLYTYDERKYGPFRSSPSKCHTCTTLVCVLAPYVCLTAVVFAGVESYVFDMRDEGVNEEVVEAVLQDAVLMPSTDASQQPLRTADDVKTALNRILMFAASAEQSSQHPLSLAILAIAAEKGLGLIPPRQGDSTVEHGMGVTLLTDEGCLLVGNRLLMANQGVALPAEVDASMSRLEDRGRTVVCVALNERILGSIAIADTIKPDAASTITALRAMGIEVWMISGDNQATSEAIAEEVGVSADHVFAGVLPAEKAFKLAELQSRYKRTVAFVGDGVNDAPALAQSDLGIAIGAGTQVALQAADMVLIQNKLSDVVVALDLAKLVFNRIKINFMFSFLYNIVAIPVAAGALYPHFRMLISPQWAGLFMALSSISVVLSSLSLRLYRPRKVHTHTNTATPLTAGLLERMNEGVTSSLDRAARGAGLLHDKKGYDSLPVAEDEESKV